MVIANVMVRVLAEKRAVALPVWEAASSSLDPEAVTKWKEVVTLSPSSPSCSAGSSSTSSVGSASSSVAVEAGASLSSTAEGSS